MKQLGGCDFRNVVVNTKVPTERRLQVQFGIFLLENFSS